MIVRNAIIDIESQFQYKGKYPWQNWTYEIGTHERKIADSFTKKTHDMEQKFLSLSDSEREQWMEEFEWKY